MTDSQALNAKARLLRAAGASRRQIATELGLPLAEVKALFRPKRRAPDRSAATPMDAAASGLEGRERVLAMAELYSSGASMQEVGVAFGVGASRVGQLFKKHGVTTRKTGEGRRATTERRRTFERAVAAEFADVGDFQVLGDVHGLSPEQAKACVRKYRPDLLPDADSRRLSSGYWTHDRLCAALRAWAEQYGEPPRASDWHPYLAWRLGYPERAERYRQGRWPNASTVVKKFGSWNAAMNAAGFEPRTPGRLDRPGDDPAVVAQAVALYRSGLGLVEAAAQGGISIGRLRRELIALGEQSPQDRMMEPARASGRGETRGP